MTKTSDKPISEIVDEVIAQDVPLDEFDEDATAEILPAAPETTNALKMIAVDSADFYPTIQKAREEAEIPEHVAVKNLVDIRILIVKKTPQKAALPDTGELRDGFFCSCLNLATKQPFTTWIGQTALVRDLSQVAVPFQATIVKHGRTYRFQ